LISRLLWIGFNVWVGEHFDNMLGQSVAYFSMTRYWLRDSGVWVPIPVVFSTVPNKNTANRFDFLD
jgi:hypothetical protein